MIDVRLIPHGGKVYWKLLKELRVVLSTGDIMVIHEGFITDFASVPRLFWGFIPPISEGALAFIVHDYMDKCRHYIDERGEAIPVTHKFSDDQMFFIQARHGEGFFRRWIMYIAVRLWDYMRPIYKYFQRLTR